MLFKVLRLCHRCACVCGRFSPPCSWRALYGTPIAGRPPFASLFISDAARRRSLRMLRGAVKVSDMFMTFITDAGRPCVSCSSGLPHSFSPRSRSLSHRRLALYGTPLADRPPFIFTSHFHAVLRISWRGSGERPASVFSKMDAELQIWKRGSQFYCTVY